MHESDDDIGTAAATPWRRGLLAHVDFRRLLIAHVVSAIGSRITRTALPIIAVNALNASASAAAFLSAMTTAPGVVVALFAGGAIDRAPKRPLLIAMDVVRAALLLTLPAAALFGFLTMAHLVVVAALTGAATAVFVVAKSAYLPRLIATEQLVDGNTKLQSAEAVAEIAGPSAAGVLIQVVTAPIAVVVDALSFLWSAWWLREIRAPEETAASAAADHPLTDIAEGWRACRNHAVVFPVLAAQATFGLFAGFFSALYMLFVLRTLGLDAATVGIIIAVGGVSALAGAFVAEPMGRLMGYGRAVVVCLIVWIVAAALIPMAEGQGALAVPYLVAQQLIGDAFLAAFFILAVSIRQAALDADVQARAGATFQAAEGIALPIGALVAGALAEIAGPGNVLWMAVGGALIPLLILTLSPLWALKRLEDLRVSA